MLCKMGTTEVPFAQVAKSHMLSFSSFFTESFMIIPS
jgi:hypothetical protein